MKNLIEGNWYKLDDRGEIFIGQYIGRQKGFECMVCGKGGNAFTFNIWHDNRGDYETWGFGKEHMPTVIECVGGIDDIIVNEEWEER